jgi:hypothetical protein
MFVSHQLVLSVSFQAAQARLENLTHGGWLSTASGGAYADGLAGLIRVGPFGDVPGASKLVKVSLLEPVPRDDVMVLSLRWEATGVTGGLFPAPCYRSVRLPGRRSDRPDLARRVHGAEDGRADCHRADGQRPGTRLPVGDQRPRGSPG